jgi:hypothetical protein
MPACRSLLLSVIVWQLLGAPSSAAPLSQATGDWAWWWWANSNSVASNWTQDQFASAFYGPGGASAAAPIQVISAPEIPSSSSSLTAPVPVAAAPSAVAPSPSVEAFINLGGGPYPLASQITTGNAQPWYGSTQISSFFGGQPTTAQVAAFDSAILQGVQQTFQQSGIPITVTTDPTVPAAHTLSLVSNTTSNTVPGVIGMTQVGGSGFSFIDQEAKSAQSLDQLQWIVAHNISHELMLAFGVPEHYDQSGNFVDARNANWSMMTSPGATFSQGASQAILTALAASPTSTTGIQGAQLLSAQPVPEPATFLLWAGGLAAAALLRRKLKERV